LELGLTLQSNQANCDSNIEAQQNRLITQNAAQQANEAATLNRLTTELSVWVCSIPEKAPPAIR